MMHMILLAIFAISAMVLCNPIADVGREIGARSLFPVACSKVKEVIAVLQVNKATPFCSTFLSITPKSATSFATTTGTSTVITGTPSTTIVFLPGDPPSAEELKRDSKRSQWGFDIGHSHGLEIGKRGATATALPSYLTAFATSAVSSGCSCLNLPTPTTTVFATSTVVVTSTISAPLAIETVYPCANGSALYGLEGGSPAITDVENSLYGSGTSGTSLTGCCNLCYFEVPNCIQAYWYFYEGCVVNQATISGTYSGVSDVCPKGNIPGLTYSLDMNPPFRSTGDIAGPCGTIYNNL